ncbi:MAG: aldo/keto reductase [Actinomycetales bacterium]|nr:MAG: aldo/keto reductase [Actinomycetales bacterium]
MDLAQRPLGHSGIQVPVVGIGCNAFGSRIDADQVQEVVDAAIDRGVTFFDTADTYGLGASEELLGAALGSRRDDVVVATKFGMDMQGRNGDDGGRRGSAAYVRTAVEASLRRLGTDHVDLYQLHTPDPLTPVEETLEALDALVQAGTVRAIGCSNFQAWQLVDADWRSRSADLARFATAQNEYSLYNRTAEVELVPACDMGGLAAQDAVTSVIAGATRPEQVRANADAVGWLPSEDDLVALSEIGAARQSYTTFAPA